MVFRLSLAGIVLAAASSALGQGGSVQVGADLLFKERFDLIEGKRVGLVTNHTGVLSDGQHIADVMASREEIKLVALFGPEHGIRGDTTGAIQDGLDPATGIPVYSLYGKRKKPTAKMLEGVDVLVFDIQDVGARFYTYISTLGHVMSAAAEFKIPVVVLDRPNPITGARVEGPVAEDSMLSFVAFAPIPIMHGMTVGELAMMYNGQGWLDRNLRIHLTVVRMKNWRRALWFDETALEWIKPSPNMLNLNTAIVYPGTCLFEGVNVSEGRGTDKPFEYVGAPWLNSAQVIELLGNAKLPGVQFESIQFTPGKRSQNAYAPKYADQGCNGIFVEVTGREEFQPVRTALHLLWAMKMIHPERFEWRERTMDRLCGTPMVRRLLDEGMSPDEIIARWKPGLEEFKVVRTKYLLYP
jgi:uncharacterized protein YbbC (DUF1343 family)